MVRSSTGRTGPKKRIDRLLDLPLTGNGAVKTGYLLDLCDRMLDCTYTGCVSRLYKLRTKETAAGDWAQSPAAAGRRRPDEGQPWNSIQPNL